MKYNMDDTSSSPKPGTRSLCCFLFAGVFIFAAGLAGGLLIGIYTGLGQMAAYGGGRGMPTGGPGQGGPGQGGQGGPGNHGPTTISGPAIATTHVTPPGACEHCSRRNPIEPFVGIEAFAPMTKDEMHFVRQFLIGRGLVSNVIGEDITLRSNYIVSMELCAPNKRNVLAFLDHNGKFPGRHAEVTVNRGARTPPDVMQYLVGPLDDMAAVNVTQLLPDGDISFNARVIDHWELEHYHHVLQPVQQVLERLVKESFDGADFNRYDIFWWPYNGPPGLHENDRHTVLNAFFNPAMLSMDYHLFDMLPLSLTIDCSHRDPQQWSAHSFHYLNQGPYDSASDLMSAYTGGSIRKLALPRGYRETLEKRSYVGRDSSKPSRAYVHLPPPRTYEPEGPRYTIQGHHVSWMGWSFDVTSRMNRGPAIFDVQFKGERIAYEISLNDISLVYGSDSHARSNVFYTDATYGIGLYTGTINGIDCPEHASVLETSFYNSYQGEASTSKSICIFEADGEGPLWRHKVNSYQAGLRDTYLVARVAGTIANYDYVIEFQFKLDGKLLTRSTATGAIQTAFWDANNANRDAGDENADARDAFGFKVSDYSHGLIHDHMFGFKVDLDVVDANNSFEVVHFKVGDALDAFRSMKATASEKPAYFRYDTTRYITYDTVQTETGYRVDPMAPKLWTVVNENYRNQWGAKRGYQIVPLATATQLLTDAHPAMAAIPWTKYNCAITKQRDTEAFIDSLFDGFRLDNPKGSLDNLLNNESIVNEDLVAWVAVGVVHVPTSEDVPMTTAIDTGFLLKPFNFFDRTDVYDMPQYYEAEADRQRPPEFEPCLEHD